MLEFIECYSPKLEGCALAIVTASLADFGMARMLATIAESTAIPVRAFHDYAAALAWLETRQSDGAPRPSARRDRDEVREERSDRAG